MKPFAYQYLEQWYDDVSENLVFPTLRALYETNKVLEIGRVEAIYPDGTRQRVEIEVFKKKVELDLDAIRAEAQERIAADVAWWNRYRNSAWFITGRAPFPPDTDLDRRVQTIVQERQWTWKTPDEVDWAAIEESLTRP